MKGSAPPHKRGAFDLRRFSSDAALVIIGAATGNAFSYVFHFMLSRRLGPSAYGTLVTLLSVATMVGVIGNSLSTVAMQQTARLWATHLDEGIAPFIRRALRLVLGVAVATALGLVLVSLPLSSYVHVREPLLWVLLAAYVAAAMFANFARGAAQGAHRFAIFAISFASEGAVKVAFSVALVALGYGVAGATGGVIASALVGFAVAIAPVIGRRGRSAALAHEDVQLGRSVLGVLAVTAAVNALLYIDMLFAKHHFSADVAGYFGAAGTVARTIPYATAFTALIIMPKAAAALHASRDTLARVLGLAAIMGAACTAGVFAVIALFPQQIVGLTYGPTFTAAIPIVRLYALDEALFALWAAANAYLVAIARYEVAVYLAAATVLEAAAMALFGSTPLRLLSIGIAVNAALIPAVWVLAVRALRCAPQAARPPSAEIAM